MCRCWEWRFFSFCFSVFWDINGEWWKCIRSRRATKLVWYSPLCFCCCQPFISSCPLPLPPAAFSMKYGLVMLLDWPWTLGSSSLPVSAPRVTGIIGSCCYLCSTSFILLLLLFFVWGMFYLQISDCPGIGCVDDAGLNSQRSTCLCWG